MNVQLCLATYHVGLQGQQIPAPIYLSAFVTLSLCACFFHFHLDMNKRNLIWIKETCDFHFFRTSFFVDFKTKIQDVTCRFFLLDILNLKLWIVNNIFFSFLLCAYYYYYYFIIIITYNAFNVYIYFYIIFM